MKTCFFFLFDLNSPFILFINFCSENDNLSITTNNKSLTDMIKLCKNDSVINISLAFNLNLSISFL